MIRQNYTILIIEDNLPDFELLKRVLIETSEGITLDILNAPTGESAINLLFKKKNYKTAKTPDLIILDLNLPTISGQEVLKTIKTTPKLQCIPVVVFSSSDAEKDIRECYEMYANSYMTKTFDVGELFSKIAIMSKYWLKVTELPNVPNVIFIDKNNNSKEKS